MMKHSSLTKTETVKFSLENIFIAFFAYLERPKSFIIWGGFMAMGGTSDFHGGQTSVDETMSANVF